tara:strand:+ start:410 stop:883 length:474 start_codon:yes stop_codon:yes gene_type:complete
MHPITRGLQVIDSYILQGLSVFFLSLWKTWLGPALSVPYGFSFWEMIGWNVSGAMLSATLTLHFNRDINALIRRLLPRRESKPRFRKELRRYVRFWRRYGFYGVMFLSPVLVGIPLGAWISARLGTPKPRILLMLAIFSVLWSSALYYAALFGIAFI